MYYNYRFWVHDNYWLDPKSVIYCTKLATGMFYLDIGHK